MTQATFKSKNGDTLSYLTVLKADTDKRLEKAQEKRQKMDEVRQALFKSECKLTAEKLLIAGRIQAWWIEFRSVK